MRYVWFQIGEPITIIGIIILCFFLEVMMNKVDDGLHHYRIKGTWNWNWAK